MWAEFGNSTWNRDAMARDSAREKWAGDFYQRYYRMAYESGANGTICWYYPGGYRWNERSDYGIINPDGSWRPVSHAIHDWAEKMTQPRERQPVDEWLVADRDATVKGIYGVYEAVKDRYWELIEAGKNPGLRRDGHGLTSENAPRVAVGNVPYREGQNPHKYLNAEFDELQIRNADGEWQTLTDGCVVEVGLHEPVLLRGTVGNIGDATWIAGEGEGRVIITGGEALFFLPEDVPFMGTVYIDGFQICELQEDMDIPIQMSVWPDVMFGEKIDISLRVAAE